MQEKNKLIDIILKDLEFFRYRKDIVSVLQDCFQMYAIALSNLFDKAKYKEREEEYLKLINSYSKEEQELICKIFGEIIFLCQIEDNNYFDFLGKLYMKSRMGNKNLGQFFTPYEVSQLIASLTVGSLDLDQEILTINEPTCGSGGTIIALIEELSKKGVSIKDRVLVVAQDIDSKCVYLTFIQLTLMGVPAIIYKGDTLSQKFTDVWRTPAYLLNFKKFNTALHK